MADVETEVKRWGNSLGVRLPRAALREEGITPGDRVRVRVEKASPTGAAFWGSLPAPKRPLDLQTWKDAERRRERSRDARRERTLRRRSG